MGSVPPNRLGTAGGILAVARNLGMALGIAGGGVTFSLAFRSAGGSSLARYEPSQAGAFTTGWRTAMFVGLLACLLALGISSVRADRPVAEPEP